MKVELFFVGISTILERLLEAKTIKGLFAVLGTVALESLIPISGFLIVGVAIMFFQILTGIMANIKQKMDATEGAPDVLVKLFLYPTIVIVTSLIQVTYIEFLPMVKLVSGYIALHEMEIAISNVRVLTGWNLKGVIELAAQFYNNRINGKNGKAK